MDKRQLHDYLGGAVTGGSVLAFVVDRIDGAPKTGALDMFILFGALEF